MSRKLAKFTRIRTARLGGHPYRIEWVRPDILNVGECETLEYVDDPAEDATISIDPQQTDHELMDTLIHEALHAIWRGAAAEDFVLHAARDIRRLLWRVGYRLKQ